MRALTLLLLLVWTARGDAAMMVHYDLSGLVLQADAVVVAERVGPGTPGPNATPRTRYRVARTLRGSVKAPQVDVYDDLYLTAGHTLEARVVLFLRTRGGDYELVPSGLRVLERGKVFRFEQHDNPGPYVMVPQGRDPHDQWGAGGAALDLAGLERAIADAARRVDALAAARREGDATKRQAAVLALVPPRASATTGFYDDVFAREAAALLATAGDLDGALLVEARSPSRGWRSTNVALADLLAVATNAKRPIELRVAALAALGQHPELLQSDTTMRAVLALVADGDAAVREAAIEIAVRPAHTMTSDRARQRALDAIAREARTALRARFAVESNPAVLVAIARVFESAFRAPRPTRAKGPIAAARARIVDNALDVEVYCLRPTTLASARLLATPPGGSPGVAGTAMLRLHCGKIPTGTGGGTPLAPGRYTLALELVTKATTVLPLGTVTVDAQGEYALSP